MRKVPREIISKRLRVRYLVVIKGYTQKEAAKMVSVSERSVCLWAKKFGWADARDKNILRPGGLAAVMEGYLVYLTEKQPSIKDDVSKTWKDYLYTLEKEFSKDFE